VGDQASFAWAAASSAKSARSSSVDDDERRCQEAEAAHDFQLAAGRERVAGTAIAVPDPFRKVHDPGVRLASRDPIAKRRRTREVADARHPGLDVGAAEVRPFDLPDEDGRGSRRAHAFDRCLPCQGCVRLRVHEHIALEAPCRKQCVRTLHEPEKRRRRCETPLITVVIRAGRQPKR
jgi:hypothetical protein